MRKNRRDQAHSNLDYLSSVPSSSLPRSSASPQLQTFYRLKGVQCWDSLVVDEIIVLLRRIVSGGQEKEEWGVLRGQQGSRT